MVTDDLLSLQPTSDGNHTAEAATATTIPQTDGCAVDTRFCCNICLEAVVEPVVTQCGHLYCWPCLYRWLEPGMYPQERASLGVPIGYAAINSSRRVCPVCKALCSVPTVVPIYVRSNSEATTTRPAEASTTTNSESKHQEDQDEPDVFPGSDPITGDATETEASIEQEAVPSSVRTGLRQRRTEVPSRPAAASPRTPTSVPSTPTSQQQQQHHYRQNNNPVWITPLSPTAHQASLTHGLLLSFLQATGSSSSSQGASSSSGVPPLHRNGGDGRSNSNMRGADLEVQATEYLSRLLLMLGSFVILCLLIL